MFVPWSDRTLYGVLWKTGKCFLSFTAWGGWGETLLPTEHFLTLILIRNNTYSSCKDPVCRRADCSVSVSSVWCSAPIYRPKSESIWLNNQSFSKIAFLHLRLNVCHISSAVLSAYSSEYHRFHLTCICLFYWLEHFRGLAQADPRPILNPADTSWIGSVNGGHLQQNQTNLNCWKNQICSLLDIVSWREKSSLSVGDVQQETRFQSESIAHLFVPSGS